MEFKTSAELIPYPYAIEFMEERVADIHLQKADELVWLLEHPSLYTAGTSAKDSDLLDPERFPVFETGRGGEHTYHGPGQRVAYVMLNLATRNQRDLRAYIRNLEQWIINTLAVLGIKGERRDGRVGIWVTNGTKEEKIAAIGVRIRKWVTYHGISINLNPDLEHFSGIVPCGLQNYGVTSIDKLGITCNDEQLNKILVEEYSNIF